jgi:hypothetical protein
MYTFYVLGLRFFALFVKYTFTYQKKKKEKKREENEGII